MIVCVVTGSHRCQLLHAGEECLLLRRVDAPIYWKRLVTAELFEFRFAGVFPPSGIIGAITLTVVAPRIAKSSGAIRIPVVSAAPRMFSAHRNGARSIHDTGDAVAIPSGKVWQFHRVVDKL